VAHPRKILLLITSLEDRGTENAALRLAGGLERTGEYAAEILALKEGSGRLRARAADEGFSRVSSLGLSSVLSLPAAVAALRRKVLAEGIDVLYSFLFHPNMVARAAGRLAGTCLIVNAERSLPGPPMSFRSAARRWSASLPDGYTAVSDAVREAMIRVLGVSPEKVRTIRNGVDVARFPERVGAFAPGGHIRLLGMGSLSPEKSFETLVAAVSLLKDGDIFCTILGEGPGRAALEARISAAGLSDRVRLAGHASDIRLLLYEADVFVQSSGREGLSNALLAAMAAGLPAVATDVGGTREAVADGETGVLVPPGDAAALAEAIRRISGRPDEARRMGERAREKAVREFTAERELAETIGWIGELRRRRAAGAVPATSRT
jgi:L-malate glycosyltransferase